MRRRIKGAVAKLLGMAGSNPMADESRAQHLHVVEALEDIRARLSEIDAVRNGPGGCFAAVRILDTLAGAALSAAEAAETNAATELNGLACHYSDCAERLAHEVTTGSAVGSRDLFPADDGSVGFVQSQNIYLTGAEVEITPDRATVPWPHLFERRDCGIFLVCGQSNAANHGDGVYAPRHQVFALNFMDMRCYRADDPLPGASGHGGSVWSQLGDLLVEQGLYRSVLFVPIAVCGTFIADWADENKPAHSRLLLTLERLRKRLGTHFIGVDGVFWQHGEAEANLTDMDAGTYQARFGSIVDALRAGGVYAPIFIARSTICEGPSPHPFKNHEEIRKGQLGLANVTRGIIAGPDIDTIGRDGRYDGCHLSALGLQQAAALWFETIARNRHLLIKAPPS